MQQAATQKDTDYIFGRGQAIFILVVISILNMVNQMDRSVFSVAQEPMRLALGLNDTQVGWFQTVFMLGLAVMTLPIAFLCDRWSRRKMLGTLAIAWSAFTFLTGLGKNFISVLMPRIFVGVGESGFNSAGQALLVRAWPDRLRGTILAVFLVMTQLGVPLGMALSGILIKAFNNWQSPFFFFAIPGVIFGILAYFLKDYETAPVTLEADGVTKENFFTSVWGLFRTPTLLSSYIGYAMYNIVSGALLAWVPTFLIRSQGMGPDKAGLFTALIGAIGLVGAILGGIVSDKWRRRNPRARMLVCAITTMVGTIAVIPSILLDLKNVGFVLACVWAFAWFFLQAPNAAVTQDCSPLDKRGQAWGVNNFLGFVTAWAPLATGAVSTSLGGDASSLKTALLLASGFGVLAALSYFIGSRYYCTDMARAAEIDRLKGPC